MHKDSHVTRPIEGGLQFVWIFIIVLFLTIGLRESLAAPAAAPNPEPAAADNALAEPEVWLCAGDRILQLLSDDAEWPFVSQHLAGIKLYVGQLQANRRQSASASAERLKRLVRFVRDHNLQVAVELGGCLDFSPLDDTSGEWSARRELAAINKFYDAGGRVDFLDIDGPIRRLMHPNNRRDGRRFESIEAAADELVDALKIHRAAHPKIQYWLLTNFPNWGWRGDVSYHARGPKRQDYGDYDQVIRTVLKKLRAADISLNGVTVDNPFEYLVGERRSVNLQDPKSVNWLARVQAYEQFARSQGLTFNLIVNSESGGHESDTQFFQQTLRMVDIYQQAGGRPSRWFVQSWYPHPKQMLPETAPYTMTALVKAVIQRVTSSETGSNHTERANDIIVSQTSINRRSVTLPQRDPPSRDFPVRQTLDVTEFGAIADDGEDDLTAIRAAMMQAQRAKEPVKVIFPKGTYDLFLPDNPEQDLIYRVTKNCLAFYQTSDIILDGQQSTIMIHYPTLGFLTLLACHDMVVRNFTIDWVTPPFAQGFVRDVDQSEGWFEFEQTPGFLSLDDPAWKTENTKGYAQIRWGMLKDREIPGRMKAGVPNVFFFKHWNKLSKNRYRIELEQPDQLKYFEIGDRYVQVDRNGGSLLGFTLCQRVTIENITNYASPGLDYGGAHSSEIGIFNCRVLVKPGAWHSSNADGMHFSQHRIGPWVEGCMFEGMSDDGANLYAHPTHVFRVISDSQFEIGPTVDWRPGDLIIGFEPQQGKVLGQARVVTAPIDRESHTTQLVLDQPIPGMQVGRPKEKQSTYFMNLDLSSSNFVFRNNSFRNVRRFGILMQSHDGLVENNTFEGVSASAIVVHNSVGWPEGFATGNIRIRGNTIRNCNFDFNHRGYNTGEIAVSVVRLDGRNGLSRAISRVDILENQIVNSSRRAISVASARDVQIEGNSIQCDDPSAPIYVDSTITPIYLRDVDRVTIRANQVLEKRSLAASKVAIEGDCSEIVYDE